MRVPVERILAARDAEEHESARAHGAEHAGHALEVAERVEHVAVAPEAVVLERRVRERKVERRDRALEELERELLRRESGELRVVGLDGAELERGDVLGAVLEEHGLKPGRLGADDEAALAADGEISPAVEGVVQGGIIICELRTALADLVAVAVDVCDGPDGLEGLAAEVGLVEEVFFEADTAAEGELVLQCGRDLAQGRAVTCWDVVKGCDTECASRLTCFGFEPGAKERKRGRGFFAYRPRRVGIDIGPVTVDCRGVVGEYGLHAIRGAVVVVVGVRTMTEVLGEITITAPVMVGVEMKESEEYEDGTGDDKEEAGTAGEALPMLYDVSPSEHEKCLGLLHGQQMGAKRLRHKQRASRFLDSHMGNNRNQKESVLIQSQMSAKGVDVLSGHRRR